MWLFAIFAAVPTLTPLLPLLPTPFEVALLPGDSRKFRLKNAQQRTFFTACVRDGDGLCGQLLKLDDGHMSHYVPVLQVVRVDISFAVLVCVGRGKLQLPVQPAPTTIDGFWGERSHHSVACVLPMRDDPMQYHPEVERRVRGQFHACTQLAGRIQTGTALSRSHARLFAEPLEDALRRRRGNLFEAAQAASGLSLSYAGAGRDRCVRGICKPWEHAAESKAGGREEAERRLETLKAFWSPSNGELQIQLLSFSLAGLLTRRNRLSAILNRDAAERLEHEAKVLRSCETRLAAEASLQSWAESVEDETPGSVY